MFYIIGHINNIIMYAFQDDQEHYRLLFLGGASKTMVLDITSYLKQHVE